MKSNRFTTTKRILSLDNNAVLSYRRQVVIARTEIFFNQKVKFIQCKHEFLHCNMNCSLSESIYSIKFCTPTLITLVHKMQFMTRSSFLWKNLKLVWRCSSETQIFVLWTVKKMHLMNSLETHAITPAETLPRYTLIWKARSCQTKDPCPRISSLPQCSMAVILKGVLKNKRQFIMTSPVHSHIY